MKILNLKNKSRFVCAETEIDNKTEDEKKQKIEEFKKIGYEYNPYFKELLETTSLDIPYEFILYCMLIENEKK